MKREREEGDTSGDEDVQPNTSKVASREAPSAAAHPSRSVQPGDRGILFTVDPRHAVQAKREVEALSTAMVAELLPSLPDDTASEVVESSSVSALLQQELQSSTGRRAPGGRPNRSRLFDFPDTKCKGYLFLRFLQQRLHVADAAKWFVERAARSSVGGLTRHTFRMYPVNRCVVPRPEAVSDAVGGVLSELTAPLALCSTPSPASSRIHLVDCSLQILVRNNTDVDRAKHLLKQAGEKPLYSYECAFPSASEVNPNSIGLSASPEPLGAVLRCRYAPTPSVMLALIVIHSVCCVCIQPHFQRFHEYNLNRMGVAVSQETLLTSVILRPQGSDKDADESS